MADEKLTTSRVGRLAKIGRAAASTAAKQAGTKAANVARSEEKSKQALDRRQIEIAEQIVTVLGGMKGAAMKVGQVLSFMDVGLVPEEYREEFQAKLAELRDSAPTVEFHQMKDVIEAELEGSIDSVFGDFDPEPIAAASIGQVYKAVYEGTPVAVKVQYPGINDAVRADMKNLNMLLRLAKRITPQLDVKAVGQEIRERIEEELDYELEASNQRAIARIYNGHPFIYVPKVITSLSRERVIVTELVEGDGFEQIKRDSQEERDRIGEIIFRFYFGSMYRHLRFSGDPHPGNLIRLRDGKVAFLDYGLFKTIDQDVADLELACARAVCERDAEELHGLMVAGGFIPRPDKLDPDNLLAFCLDGIWWYTTDEEMTITQEDVTRAAIQVSDPRSTHYSTARHQDIDPEHLFGRRLELLTLAVLGNLEPRNNWHRIAREWIYGDDPVTDLGKQESEFFAG